MALIFGTDDSDTLPGTIGSDDVRGWQQNREAEDTGADTLSGLEGSDTLSGGGGADSLLGGAGHDQLRDDRTTSFIGSFTGPVFNDVLHGGDGNDLLESLGGRDALFGGNGSDYALVDRSGATADLTFDLVDTSATTVLFGDGTRLRSVEYLSLDGGSGNDRFSASAGVVSFHGGAGDDTLISSIPDGWLAGGDGNDSLQGGEERDDLFDNDGFAWSIDDDVLSAGGGEDRLHSWGGRDTLSGGAGFDRAEIDRSEATVDLSFVMTGTSGFTVLDGNGTRVRQVEAVDLYGGSGDDRFVTLGGEDDLNGGAGDDRLQGRQGHDHLSGDAGNDILVGGAGHDYLYGDLTITSDDGNDSLSGGGGRDYLNSWGGADTLDGGSGQDEGFITRSNATADLTFRLTDLGQFAVLQGDGTQVRGIEDLSLNSGGGDDRFSASVGRVSFFGGGGDDSLTGGSGDDSLGGQEGSDTLQGRAGDDLLYCGSVRPAGDDAADVLRFAGRFGNDEVREFQDGSDRLEFVGFTEADLTISFFRRDVILTLDNGVAKGTVTIADFPRTGIFDASDYFFS